LQEAKTAGKNIRDSNNSRDSQEHINRKVLNSRRDGNIISDSNPASRDSRNETTAVRTHQQLARQQHKRQLEQQETPTAGMPKPVETSEEEGMLTTVGTPQQEL
jgi:hypothetical protein